MSQINQYIYNTPEERFWARVDKSGECWDWLGGKDRDGYGKILTYGKYNRAHRFAWEIENGEIPDGMVVCHVCDRPCCVRLSHLFLGTVADNNKDCTVKLRHFSKLNELQVRIIRRCEKRVFKQKYLAEIFGVGQTIICNIRNGKKWNYL